jgi:nitrogen regulatory protein PII
MKEIKAIIQPFMLSKVINALKEIGGLPGVTVSEVKGFGKSRAANAANKIVEESIEYAKKVKLEIVVPDSLLDQVVNAICAKARLIPDERATVRSSSTRWMKSSRFGAGKKVNRQFDKLTE